MTALLIGSGKGQEIRGEGRCLALSVVIVVVEAVVVVVLCLVIV